MNNFKPHSENTKAYKVVLKMMVHCWVARITRHLCEHYPCGGGGGGHLFLCFGCVGSDVGEKKMVSAAGTEALSFNRTPYCPKPSPTPPPPPPATKQKSHAWTRSEDMKQPTSILWETRFGYESPNFSWWDFGLELSDEFCRRSLTTRTSFCSGFGFPCKQLETKKGYAFLLPRILAHPNYRMSMGCSPLYEQSLIGIIMGGAIIPIKDVFSERGNIPTLNPKP